MATVGMVGLGAMGAPMARNLLKAGHTLKVYDQAEDAVDALVARGWAGVPGQWRLAAGPDQPLNEAARCANWIKDQWLVNH